MARDVNPIPEGFHSVTANLVVRRASEAIEYYKRAFSAHQVFRMDRPDGKVVHALLKIGDSMVMLADECDEHEGHEKSCVRSPEDLHGTSVNLYLYVDDADSVFDRAVEAGGEAMTDISDMFWGDRMGVVKDPFGHFWTVATQIEEVSDVEMKQRTKQFMETV